MIKKTKETAAYRRVASELKRLLTDGMVIEGTLAEIHSGSAVHYQLTRKVKGRTQTDYVPLARKGDVEDWIRIPVSILSPDFCYNVAHERSTQSALRGDEL